MRYGPIISELRKGEMRERKENGSALQCSAVVSDGDKQPQWRAGCAAAMHARPADSHRNQRDSTFGRTGEQAF